ncbi:uncharacterized protein PHACADRAFT_169821 [Phanerochaete carnosa HHB-10118-sp]|uniref:Uncharacterized protein n=1 Tax=Phanerochaete carnosa (strain HHB-10118-sp) TaxID=650164 RepID=K5V923_PHACS|nr:uncharacterized protein PHACADRAFT_169821 [Phanerochaete carnosa HHB-10118-sp]EKM59296.1 hypothetical protein PHACADRAFT_169821 [Phanerochaete carnosa HHB-10118-sp]
MSRIKRGPPRSPNSLFSTSVMHMDPFSVISPDDFGGLRGHEGQERSGPMPKFEERTTARRSAGARSSQPSSSTSHSDTSRPAKARASKSNGVTKHSHGSRARRSDRGGRGTLQTNGHSALRTAASGGARTNASASSRSSHRRREAQAQKPPTHERIRRARAAADLSSLGCGKDVSIMDVILDAQAPTARLDADDLLDAIEQCQRTALARPSAEDDVLADMFVPGRYEARQIAFWQDVTAALEYAPKSLYRLSAERSTAAWDTASDSKPL